jgi:sporulation protein YlmC with PRC-barrel domain
MMNVVENTSRQELAGGKRVKILTVTGDTVSGQVVDVVFSIKTETKKTYVLVTKGTTLVLDKTKDNILSLTVLLQSGFKVDFGIVNVDDPSFAGVLTTPTGVRVTLLFENNSTVSD